MTHGIEQATPDVAADLNAALALGGTPEQQAQAAQQSAERNGPALSAALQGISAPAPVAAPTLTRSPSPSPTPDTTPQLLESADARLERLLFEEDETAPDPARPSRGYTMKVQLDDDATVFYVAEAPKEVLRKYSDAVYAFERGGRKLADLATQLREKITQAPEDEREAQEEAARLQLEESTDALFDGLMDAHTYLLERTLRGWHNPGPRPLPACTPRNIARLARSVKAELAEKIARRSRMSQSAADFLGQS